LLISKCGQQQLAHADTSFDPVASILVRALRGDPADLLVRAGGGRGGSGGSNCAHFLV